MNNDWKQYLQTGTSSSEEIADTAISDITKADLSKVDNQTILCDLSQFDTVVIAGEDAASFMQGQFTNDVDKVDDDHCQLSAICNSKGRMIANFRLFKYQQNYFLSLKSDLTEKTIQHLQNYQLRAQVAIQDVSDQLIHIGICGNDAPELLAPYIENIIQTAPEQKTDDICANEDYIAIRVADDRPRYEIFCSFEKARALWENISKTADIVNPDVWDYLNIRSGIPMIDSSTSEEFVPQMANMDLINGVSFTKGCFTGQEIIARTHYLGKQKRRTYRIKINSENEPVNGSQLATDTSTENQYTGTVITNYKTAEDTYEALAVIQIKAADEGKLKLKEGDSKISLLDLPYSLEDIE